MIEAKYPDYAKPDKSGLDYRQKAKLYLDSAIYYLETFMKNNPDLEIVGCEIRFKQEYDPEHDINGSIDRLFRNKKTGEYIIQDIKSWGTMDDVTRELAHPLQFYFYAQAVLEKFKTTVDKLSGTYYVPLLECGVHDVKLVEKYESCKKMLAENFEGIMKEEFYPIKTALCHWCEFCNTNPNQPKGAKDLCPYHSLWTKKGDDVKASVVG